MIGGSGTIGRRVVERLTARGLPVLVGSRSGDVSGFAPPGDIHRVHNTADTTAISIHVYGTDSPASAPAPDATTTDLDQVRQQAFSPSTKEQQSCH
jgi:uncharacterized protein YbjT (DUF2867 family)